MSDIRSLGPRGEAIFKTAESLKEKQLVSDAQFKELTNAQIKPEDLKIADEALNKTQAKHGVQTLFDIGSMQNDFNRLKLDEVKKNVEAAQAQRGGNAQQPAQHEGPLGFIMNFLDSLPSSKDIIQRIDR